MPHADLEARRKYRNEYMRKRYAEDAKHKARHVERTRKNDAVYKANTQSLIAAFRAAGCALCHENTPACLSAHHLDAADKEFHVGNAVRMKFSPKRVAAELAKCACLCHNCHAKVHAGLISLLPTT